MVLEPSSLPPLFEAKANDVTLLHLDSLELAQLQRRLEHLGGWILDQWLSAGWVVGGRFFGNPGNPKFTRVLWWACLIHLLCFTMISYDHYDLWFTVEIQSSRYTVYVVGWFLKGTVMPWFLGRNIVFMCSFLAFASAIDLCPCFLIIATSLSRDIQMGQLGLSMNLGKNQQKPMKHQKTSSLKGLSEKHPLFWNSKTLQGLFVVRHRFGIHISLTELLDCQRPSQLLEAVMRQDFLLLLGNYTPVN